MNVSRYDKKYFENLSQIFIFMSNLPSYKSKYYLFSPILILGLNDDYGSYFDLVPSKSIIYFFSFDRNHIIKYLT